RVSGGREDRICADERASEEAARERTGRGGSGRIRLARADLSLEAEAHGGPETVVGGNRGAVEPSAGGIQSARAEEPEMTSKVFLALRVPADPMRAFKVFTQEIASWWQPSGLFRVSDTGDGRLALDRKSTRLNSSHSQISY